MERASGGGPGCLSLCVCLVPTCLAMVDLALQVGSGGLHPTAPIIGNGEQGHSCCGSGWTLTPLMQEFASESSVGPEELMDHWESVKAVSALPPMLTVMTEMRVPGSESWVLGDPHVEVSGFPVL